MLFTVTRPVPQSITGHRFKRSKRSLGLGIEWAGVEWAVIVLGLSAALEIVALLRIAGLTERL